jgi:hypothetical protein
MIVGQSTIVAKLARRLTRRCHQPPRVQTSAALPHRHGNATIVCGSKEWWRLSVDRYDVMHHDPSVRNTCDVIADLVHRAPAVNKVGSIVKGTMRR